MLPAVLIAAGVGFVVWRLTHPKGPLLDVHLPKETEDAVVIAASHEKNPQRLRAFAQSLLPDFPSAASALFARAVAITPTSAGGFQGLFTYADLDRAPGGDVYTYATAGDAAGGFNL